MTVRKTENKFSMLDNVWDIAVSVSIAPINGNYSVSAQYKRQDIRLYEYRKGSLLAAMSWNGKSLGEKKTVAVPTAEC